MSNPLDPATPIWCDFTFVVTGRRSECRARGFRLECEHGGRVDDGSATSRKGTAADKWRNAGAIQ